MFYAIMNDYYSSLVPKYLHAIIDDKKQVNTSWEYNSSEHSYPGYIVEKECPDPIYLLCRKDVGALKFPYYKHGMGHILSADMYKVISNLRVSDFYSRNLIATSIGNGDVLRDDMKYLYVVGGNDLIDLSKSRIEEDKRGRKIPYDLTFKEEANKYDVFSIRETVLRGFLFISSNVISNFEHIKGIKIIPLNEVLMNYCSDYGYDLQGNRKNSNRKLP